MTRRVAIDVFEDVFIRRAYCVDPSSFLKAWHLICPFNVPRHASPSVAETIAETWSLQDNRASAGTVSNAVLVSCPAKSSAVGVHSIDGHVPHVAGHALSASTILPNNLYGALPQWSAMFAQPNASSSIRHRDVVVTVRVAVVVALLVYELVAEDVAVLVCVVLAQPDVSTSDGVCLNL